MAHAQHTSEIAPERGQAAAATGVTGMERLAALAAAPQEGVEGVVGPLLTLLAECLDGGLTFLAHVDGPSLVIDRAHDRAAMGLRSGDVIPLGDTYCQALLAGDAPALVVADAAADPHFAALATTRDLGIGAYCGVPLRRADGRLYGTLCTLHTRAHAIDADDLALLTVAGGIAMRAIEAEERREREQRVRQDLAAAESARAIYGALASGVVLLDGAGAILDANPAAEDLLGVSLGEMRGRVLSDSLWPATRLDGSPLPRAERPALAALRTGQPQRGVIVRLSRPDGEQRVVQIDAALLPDTEGADGIDGVGPRVVVSYVDITVRVATEEGRRAREARFRALTEQATDLVSIVATDGSLTYSSPSHARLLGAPPAPEEGMDVRALVHPEDRAAVRSFMAAAFATTEPPPPIVFRRRRSCSAVARPTGAGAGWRRSATIASPTRQSPASS